MKQRFNLFFFIFTFMTIDIQTSTSQQHLQKDLLSRSPTKFHKEHFYKNDVHVLLHKVHKKVEILENRLKNIKKQLDLDIEKLNSLK